LDDDDERAFTIDEIAEGLRENTSNDDNVGDTINMLIGHEPLRSEITGSVTEYDPTLHLAIQPLFSSQGCPDEEGGWMYWSFRVDPASGFPTRLAKRRPRM
jgi:hypothetical protein